jgi:hypothetical protein
MGNVPWKTNRGAVSNLGKHDRLLEAEACIRRLASVSSNTLSGGLRHVLKTLDASTARTKGAADATAAPFQA